MLAESYLDFRRPQFDRSLRHEYSEWKALIDPFPYHGLNVYAYLLSKYGRSDGDAETFQFVTVQLYEGYSHFQYACSELHQDPSDALVTFVRGMTTGYYLDFSSDVELSYPVRQLIEVPANKLVIGLANGWAGDGKFPLVLPTDVSLYYHS
jgi:hypothetical protein